MPVTTQTDRTVGMIARGFDRIAIVANGLGTLTVLGLVAIMNVDIVARGVFHAPLRGVVEVVIFSMVLIVFLQLPDVIRVGRLTRSDGFLTWVCGRYPTAGIVLCRVIDLVSCALMALIAYATYPELLHAFGTCHYFTPPDFGPEFTGDFWTDISDATARCLYFGTPGIFTAPWWPVRLVITLSAGLCAILFLFKALAARHPGAEKSP